MRTHSKQMFGRQHGNPGYQCRFIRTRPGDQQAALRYLGGDGRRQCSTHSSQCSRECQFAHQLTVLQRFGGKLTGGGKDADGDRQVVAAAFLGQVGRRQIDGDPPHRHLEAAVEQRTAHAVARLPDRRFRQADNGHARQSVGQVHPQR